METAGPSDPEDLISLLRSGRAPRDVRLFAARGLLPLDPDSGIVALLAVVADADVEIATTARETLRATPPDRLVLFSGSGAATETELDRLARESEDPFVLEQIIRSRAAGTDTLLFLARTAVGRPQEALIANQSRLLEQPALIGALLENPSLTSDGRRLLSELQEEFFEKEARRFEADLRRRAEQPPGASEGEEEVFEEAEEEIGEEEPAEAPPEEPKDSLFIGAIYRRIGKMTVHAKIELGLKGSKEERRILIGDTNKLVGLAVLKSPAISTNEVESFCAMRNLDEELFRRITWNREWMRKPAVILALVRNPRVPIDIALPLLKRLTVRELRTVVRDRNLSPTIRGSARHMLVLKRR